MSSDDGAIVSLSEIHDFVVRCMGSLGIPENHGNELADLLVSADYRGHYSHGLNGLSSYVADITNKTTATSGAPEIIKETVATALVNGNNILGPVVGRFCMDLAIQKAKTAGIGWVSARGSNHYGIAGWYGLRALESGLMGMAFTNTSPLLVPTRAKQKVLGTNPICVAAPGKNGDNFVLDMATTAVAHGKISLADRKGEEIPEGWAVDKQGQSTTDPKQAHGLFPLGWTERTSGYKGYGLSMMVEIFCGILSGSMYAHHIREWKEDSDIQANLGQCFVAIDVSVFADGFEDRMSELLDFCRNLTPAPGESEVHVAGDPSRKHMEKCDRQGGIRYHPSQISYANEIAAKLKVAPMKTT